MVQYCCETLHLNQLQSPVTSANGRVIDQCIFSTMSANDKHIIAPGQRYVDGKKGVVEG